MVHDVFAKIKQIDPELANALQRYHSYLVAVNPEPHYALLRYPLREHIFDKGCPLAPGRCRFPDELIHKSGFPFGIILEGRAEVVDYNIEADAPMRAPQAVLKTAEFIGLFEFTDSFSGSVSRSPPDWTITAGMSSLSCIHETSTKAFSDHLRKRFGNFNNEIIKRESLGLVDKLLSVPGVRDVLGGSMTEVLFFGVDWFDLDLNESEDEGFKESFERLLLVLFKRAWRSITRVRPTTTTIARYFETQIERGAGSMPRLHEMHRNVRTFVNLHSLFVGRRPVFVPSEERGRPEVISYLCNEVLSGYRNDKEPTVMYSEYLDETPLGIGFMPTLNVYSLLGHTKSQEGELLDLLNAVHAASQNEDRDGGFSILRSYDSLISSIRVRLPAGKDTRNKMKASTVTYSLATSGDGVKLDQIEGKLFFEPYVYKPERPGDSFFRSCIRFSKSDQ